VNGFAVDLAALGDTDPLWRDWLDDARRRFKIEGASLDDELPNWRRLLERYAEERAPVYFRRDADVSEALRRLRAHGARVAVFTDVPEELARVALAHLGAARRIETLESGSGAEERAVARLGAGAAVVRTRAELLAIT
jgi:phosphoglycolate phosphatase-like HAD superfamily hydrolase